MKIINPKIDDLYLLKCGDPFVVGKIFHISHHDIWFLLPKTAVYKNNITLICCLDFGIDQKYIGQFYFVSPPNGASWVFKKLCNKCYSNENNKS